MLLLYCTFEPRLETETAETGVHRMTSRIWLQLDQDTAELETQQNWRHSRIGLQLHQQNWRHSRIGLQLDKDTAATGKTEQWLIFLKPTGQRC